MLDVTVRSNSSESSGLKSRTRSCPYALVASGSGVAVTRGREFPNSKTAGRNASEPMSSLGNELEKPTLWSEGEGRWMRARITEVARIDSRGSKDGMSWKIYCPVLDTRCAGWGDRQRLRIRKRKRSRVQRESEGFIVPPVAQGQHNPERGKEPCFVRATEEPRVRGLPSCCSPREVTRKLQRKLCAKAKQETVFCYALHIRVRRRDILSRANRRRMGKCACLSMKNIGKPCAGKLHARFDEGGQAQACPLLYPAAGTQCSVYCAAPKKARQGRCGAPLTVRARRHLTELEIRSLLALLWDGAEGAFSRPLDEACSPYLLLLTSSRAACQHSMPLRQRSKRLRMP